MNFSIIFSKNYFDPKTHKYGSNVIFVSIHLCANPTGNFIILTIKQRIGSTEMSLNVQEMDDTERQRRHI